MNREQWLTACLGFLRILFGYADVVLPERIGVLCSWASRGSLRKRGPKVTECWCRRSADGSWEILVSLGLDEPIAVATALIDALVHVATGPKHGREFGALMRAVGLEGKKTAPVAGCELFWRLNVIISDHLGNYAHLALNGAPEDAAQQHGRTVRVSCCTCRCSFWVSPCYVTVKVPSCWLCGAPMTVHQKPAGGSTRNKAADRGMSRADVPPQPRAVV